MIGDAVSHYKILSKLGEGGMGVVYKAEDLKLTRTVALKFLPHGLDAHQPERERFLQEARAAATLNHPNICTVHDIQEHEGQQFIVMEYVEGKTLREIIPVKKMQDAITYAIQIAEGLHEAHTHGIVHRDIKAENIMVNTKNQVKVMDFGLAKLKGSLKLTKTSSTIGTLAYMAPEQIEGGEVDARSDIFSFGIVLYEMLTGHLPFRGVHEAAMMYSIVNEPPEPLQDYVPDAPSELLHILDRSLEKDREDRYQTVHDMLIDLRRLKKDSTRVLRQSQPGAQKPDTAEREAVAEHIKGRNKRLWLGAAGLLVLCSVSVLVYFLIRSPSPRLNPNRTSVTLKIPFRQTLYPSISRDGSWVAFPAQDEAGKYDVYLMHLAGGEPRKITHESATMIEGVEISPDVSQIVYDYRQEPGQAKGLRIVASQGGESRTVAEIGACPKWRPDGQRIGYMWYEVGDGSGVPGRQVIWSIKPDGTDKRIELIDSLSARGDPASFCWSPDGRSIVWERNYPEGYGEVMVRDLETGKERQLTFDKKTVDEVFWATNGVILFVSNKSGQTNLWMTSAGGGDATQITHGGVPINGARISADNSTLVYLQREEVAHIWTSDIDGTNARQVTFDDVRLVGASFSPDREHISYLSGDVDVFHQDIHLTVMDRDGKNPRQLTSGPQMVTTYIWSPDGRWIAYSSRALGEPEDSSRIYLIEPFNPGPPRLLCSCKGTATGVAWCVSPDWKWIAYTYRTPGEPADSVRTYLIQPFNPGPPRLMGKGEPMWWPDSENLLVFSQMSTLRYSIATGMATQVGLDSTYALVTQSAKQFVFFDFRKGREGWWTSSLDALGKPKGEARRIFLSALGYGVVRHRHFIIYRRGDEIWRVWRLSGKEERIGRTLPGDARLRNASRDGSELLWFRQENRAKLVLVKNVFE